MELGIKGKNALVTGGATGLGAKIVEALASEGANVAFTYLSEKENPEKLVNHVKEKYDVKLVPVLANIGDEEQINRLFEEAYEALGDIHILVNNAGIWLSGKVGEIPSKDWDLTQEINLRAPFLLSQLFVNKAKEKGYKGHIINITSQAAFHGSTTGHSHYAASKAGLIAFSISLAREVASLGINVNNIAVGIMRTPMIEKQLEEKPDYYVNRIPAGRVAEPEEIANFVLFLASDQASYMTGTTMDATGGMLMR